MIVAQPIAAGIGFDTIAVITAASSKNLRAAGVAVELIDYPAMPHGFLNFPRFARDARPAIAAVIRSQRAALGA